MISSTPSHSPTRPLEKLPAKCRLPAVSTSSYRVNHCRENPVAMQNCMRNLIARMSKPFRIRVGGNGMDGSLKNPMLELPDPDAYFNAIPAHFGSVLFDVLNAMADKVGDMQYLIGVELQACGMATTSPTSLSSPRIPRICSGSLGFHALGD